MENVRPTFLTVLCILTFLGSAYFIYSGISGFTSSETVVGTFEEQFEQMQDQMSANADSEEVATAFDSVKASITPENFKNFSLALLITSIITMVGAVLMWGMKKTGFYVYVVGTLAGIIVPAMTFGGIIGMGFAMFFGFFGVLFTVLYGLNLKHLS